MTDSQRNMERARARVGTGVPGLDAVLRGGLMAGGIYIVTGHPGAGKTVLANQICFHHLAGDGRAVYVTLLSETHARMLANLSTFDFFDKRVLDADRLAYFSAFGELESKGIPGLLALLRAAVRDRKASLVVIDGMVTAEQLAEPLAYKKFVQELQTWVDIHHCTVLLLTTSAAGDGVQPVQTMVDGILELHDRARDQRRLRELVVTKFRGGAFLEGRHAYAIGSGGVHVYPRIEALLREREARFRGNALLPTGVDGLDALVGGGLRQGSCTMVLGSSGSGKTVLGLQWLSAGAERGDRGLLFGFFENPESIAAKCERLSFPWTKHVEAGRLAMVWRRASEQILDALIEDLLAAVAKHEAKRVFIDGLVGFMEAGGYPERVSTAFAALREELGSRGVTTLLTEETRELFVREIVAPVGGISAICENILFLRHVELGAQLKRLVAVLKTRDTTHDRGLYEFEIEDSGLVVGERFDPQRSVLTGVAETHRTAREPA